MIPAELPSAANFAAPSHRSPCAQSYQQRLHPWLIIRQLPQRQRLSMARFRKRPEAEAYLKVLQRLSPDASYQIVFDPPEPEPSGSTP
jgi:hypothetical protein